MIPIEFVDVSAPAENKSNTRDTNCLSNNSHKFMYKRGSIMKDYKGTK